MAKIENLEEMLKEIAFLREEEKCLKEERRQAEREARLKIFEDLREQLQNRRNELRRGTLAGSREEETRTKPVE